MVASAGSASRKRGFLVSCVLRCKEPLSTERLATESTPSELSGLSAATLPCGIAETEATQSAAARAERRAIVLEVW